MILIIYRIICVYISIVLIWNLFKSKNIWDKMIYAIILMPFMLRTLLIKLNRDIKR